MKTYTEEEWNEDYEDSPSPIYCEMCLKRGNKNNLVAGTLSPGEKKPIEADINEWLRCLTCGWLCPIYPEEDPKIQSFREGW